MKRALRIACLMLAVLPALGAIELDPSWGDRGIVRTTAEGEPFAIGIQPDGKVIVASGRLLIRYLRDGRLDATFGDEGILTIPDPAYFRAMVIEPNGKIVLAGLVSGGTDFSFHALRLLPDGSPDVSFGVGGFVTSGFPGVSAGASAVALQRDGKIVLAGGSGTPLPPTAGDFAAIRYDTQGALDVSFGSAGLAVLDMGGTTQEVARSAAVDSHGRIVIGGFANTPSGARCAIGALRPDGQPDGTFGVDGRQFISVAQFNSCEDIALTPDNKIVAALATFPEEGVFAARLRPDGSLDPAFGSSGVAKIDIDGETSKIGVDRTGRVVVAGTYLSSFLVARFLPDGRPDLTVGSGGWTRPPIGGNPPQQQAQATALALQADGAILAAGPESIVVFGVVTTVRYLEDVAAVPGLSVSGLLVLATTLGATGWLAARRTP